MVQMASGSLMVLKKLSVCAHGAYGFWDLDGAEDAVGGCKHGADGFWESDETEEAVGGSRHVQMASGALMVQKMLLGV